MSLQTEQSGYRLLPLRQQRRHTVKIHPLWFLFSLVFINRPALLQLLHHCFFYTSAKEQLFLFGTWFISSTEIWLLVDEISWLKFSFVMFENDTWGALFADLSADIFEVLLCGKCVKLSHNTGVFLYFFFPWYNWIASHLIDTLMWIDVLLHPHLNQYDNSYWLILMSLRSPGNYLQLPAKGYIQKPTVAYICTYTHQNKFVIVPILSKTMYWLSIIFVA